MRQQCLTCLHPERDQIDKALLSGTSPETLARRYTALSRAGLYRHLSNLIPKALAKAVSAEISAVKDAEELQRGKSLLEKLRELEQKAMSILNQAERCKNLRTALVALKECRATLELAARVTGELDSGADQAPRTPQPMFVLPTGTQIKIQLIERDMKLRHESRAKELPAIDITPEHRKALPSGISTPEEECP